MRMSCNGCRVLRKGCGEGCSIRPCLQWIKNPEAQANATVFLAKFYGRAGLMNLMNAGPDHLRPAIFRSLLYEACGRIVNPIYGSVGLLWSGNWQMCQAAVEAVLKGAPIVQIPSEAAASTPTPPLRAYDIRHISKDADRAAAAAAADGVHKVAKSSRTRFKRAAAKPKPASPHPPPEVEREPEPEQAAEAEHSECAPSHESSDASHGHVDDEMAVLEEAHARGEGQEVSVEAGSHVSQAEQSPAPLRQEEADGVELELTLGLPQASRAARPVSADARCDLSIWSAESGHKGLRLELTERF